MNRRLMAAAVLLAVAIGTPAAAFAQATSSGLTRADVIADLVHAQRDGVVPAPKRDYPPSAQTIALNRARYAVAHGEQGTATASASASVSTMSAR
ncbi:DUF4148 domain-containing protein [Burkholderia sp. 4701]|nr:DUF4148 domain-containing protein [Burkholderia sp. 4701]MXN84983.1 DUF4148 domain-containing protein [Burkholderia sp. 4812]